MFCVEILLLPAIYFVNRCTLLVVSIVKKRVLVFLTYTYTFMYKQFKFTDDGFSHIYIYTYILCSMQIDRRSLKFAAKDFEQNFDDTHYPKTETVQWINRIVSTVWFNHPVTLSNMAKDQVQPILDANCPPPLVCINLNEMETGKV